jgi:uncharacterized protein YprB with RNaseH-like and TPR domain
VSKLHDRLQRLSPPFSPVSVPLPVPVNAVPSSPSPSLPDRSPLLSQLRAQMDRIGKKLDRAPRPPFRPQQDEDYADAPFEARINAFALTSSPLPGERSEGADGPLRMVRTEYAEDHCHGTVPVNSALSAVAADIAVLALDSTLAEVDLSRALYIDTETTGLAGGTGTLPFLIGMAWFEGRNLCVEQMLLEKPGLEAPMLTRLAERIAVSSVIVSFNGKSFDWPLLRTRFVLTRVASPRLPPHLDLLHCARRVYKRRLGSVRLVHLEEQVLGFTRVDDIPGELIPETYLGFLRGNVPGAALAPIIEHNRHDLVALAAILGEISRRFRDHDLQQDARDQLGFAGVAARARNDVGASRARLFAQGAADADVRGELAPEAHFLHGELCLRAGDLPGAERAWLLSIAAACANVSAAARAHLALAKLYEHQLKRVEAALTHAHGAATLEGAEASLRRLSRLTRKSETAQQRFTTRDL